MLAFNYKNDELWLFNLLRTNINYKSSSIRIFSLDFYIYEDICIGYTYGVSRDFVNDCLGRIKLFHQGILKEK